VPAGHLRGVAVRDSLAPVPTRRPESDEDAPASRLALRALAELRPALDRLEVALVDRARLEQVSWALIASDLGVTKQTAHRRHARHDPVAARRRKGRPAELAGIVTEFDDDEWLMELLANEIAMRRARASQ